MQLDKFHSLLTRATTAEEQLTAVYRDTKNNAGKAGTESIFS